MERCRFRQQEMAEYALLGPPHPGEVLREVIWPRLNLTRKLAAQRMGIPLSALSNLLNERRRVSRGLAVELARITGTKAVLLVGPPGALRRLGIGEWASHNEA